MRRTLLGLTAIIAITAALDDPAHSASGLWKQTEYWTVSGHTGVNVCVAHAEYVADISILVGFNGSEWSFGLSGISATTGDIRKARILFSNGQFFVAEMAGINDGLVMAKGIKDEFVRGLIVSESFIIEGLGKYPLTGSAEAIRETYQCQRALADAAVSAVKAVSRET